MNTKPVPIDVEDFCPSVRSIPRLTPVSWSETEDEELDVHPFSGHQDGGPGESSFMPPLPAQQIPVLKVEAPKIPASRLRRIALEISENDYDPQTVFRSCRGLTKGTRGFDDAYISAPIRSFAKCQRNSINPDLFKHLCATDASPEQLSGIPGRPFPPPSHPMAVIYLRQLMDHFSFWVIALLVAQVWCSWKAGGFVSEFLKGGQPLYVGIFLFVMMALDTGVWFRRRGNLSYDFHGPGVLLFLVALIPPFLLYLRGVLQFSQ